jgi:hypothetical protein
MIVWVALLTSYEYSTGFCRKCALNVSILHGANNLVLIFTAIDCRQDYHVFGATVLEERWSSRIHPNGGLTAEGPEFDY